MIFFSHFASWLWETGNGDSDYVLGFKTRWPVEVWSQYTMMTSRGQYTLLYRLLGNMQHPPYKRWPIEEVLLKYTSSYEPFKLASNKHTTITLLYRRLDGQQHPAYKTWALEEALLKNSPSQEPFKLAYNTHTSEVKRTIHTTPQRHLINNHPYKSEKIGTRSTLDPWITVFKMNRIIWMENYRQSSTS